MVKGSTEPIRLYTCDVDVSKLELDELKPLRSNEEMRRTRVR
jgi:hypothetical protein